MDILLVPLFFVTALVYSMAGLAGGSTYLALLALFGVPYGWIPRVALTCNLVVSAGGSLHFSKHLSLKKVLPFIVTSIPMAFLGGSVPIGKKLFTILLGLSLLVAAVRLLISEQTFVRRDVTWKESWLLGLPTGAVLGFFCGLVGIGGGIFLSPILLLWGSADSKQAAAAASLFILVNSLAGLAGQLSKGAWEVPVVIFAPLLIAAFLGGQIGSRLGSQKISRFVLQKITAALILLVSGRLLWGLAAGVGGVR